MVLFDGGRSFLSRAETASACLRTRSTFSPASFLRSASDHPRRASSVNRSGNYDTSSSPTTRTLIPSKSLPIPT
jgi:hypothetical protein